MNAWSMCDEATEAEPMKVFTCHSFTKVNTILGNSLTNMEIVTLQIKIKSNSTLPNLYTSLLYFVIVIGIHICVK